MRNDLEPRDKYKDGWAGDLFEHKGVVCQLMGRYPWYAKENNTGAALWGARAFLPNGETLHLARTCETANHAARVIRVRVDDALLRIQLDNLIGETPCPTTVATTV